MEKLLSITEAAAKIGVNPGTLRRWDKSGKFPSVRNPINKYRAYPESQLDEFLKLFDPNKNHNYQNNTFEKTAPFFQTKFGSLYKIDAVDFLKSLDDNSVDLIFADPPYNIKKAEWDTFSSQKEYVEWSMSWIKEANRVLSDRGSLFICGFSEILADLKWAASPFFEGCKWLIWYYRNKGNLTNDWGRSHESILHFRKSRDFIFNIDEVRIPYNQHTVRYPARTQAASSHFSNGKNNNYVWEPHPLGAKPKDVIEIPTLSNGSWERTAHETQKPVELLKKIILSSSNSDSLIVDPFGGSGTTFAVAEAYGRKWAGSELEEKYCKIIKNRVTDRDHVFRIRNGKDDIKSIERRVKLRG